MTWLLKKKRFPKYMFMSKLISANNAIFFPSQLRAKEEHVRLPAERRCNASPLLAPGFLSTHRFISSLIGVADGRSGWRYFTHYSSFRSVAISRTKFGVYCACVQKCMSYQYSRMLHRIHYINKIGNCILISITEKHPKAFHFI